MWTNHWWNPSQRVRYHITVCIGLGLLYVNESLMKPLTESQVRYYCVYWTGCVICERITDETPHRESGTVLVCVLDWVCYMWTNHWWNPSQRVRYGISVCIGLGLLYVNESLMKPLTESQVRYYCVYWTGCVICERITDETPHRESGTVLLCVLDWVCYMWMNHWWNPSQRVRYHITVCIGLGVLYVNESLMKPLTESQVPYYCVYWTGCVICERIADETPHRESGTVLVCIGLGVLYVNESLMKPLTESQVPYYCVLDWVCYMWTNHWWNPSQRVRYGITVCIGLGVLYVNESLMKPLTESQVPYYCVYWTGCVICERITDETPHRESGTVLLCVLDWVCYMWTNHWWNPSQRVRYCITVCIGLGVLCVNESLMKPLTESQVRYYCVYWTGCVMCERITDETPHRESGMVLVCVLDWVCYMWTNHWWNPSQRVRYCISVCIGLGVLYVNESLMKPLTESQVLY